MAHRIPSVYFPLLLTFLLAGAVGRADGFRNPPAGASAPGRIGGRIAYTPDISAVVHNPANLVEFDEYRLLGAATFGYSKSKYSAPDGRRAESRDPEYVLPSLFAVYPASEERPVTFGLALTSPYGRSTRLEEDGTFFFTAPYYTQLISLDLAPTFAWWLTDQVSVGVSAHVLWSEVDLRQIYPWGLVAGNPALPNGKTLFSADGAGAGVSAAATWRMNDRQRLAVTWRSPIEVDYSGDLTVTNIPPGGPGAPTSDFETSITFPMEVALAYGIRLTDTLTLETNVEWVQHSEFEALELDAGVNTPLLPSDEIPTDWDDNWTYGISAAWRISPEWVLRSGYVYLESPIPSETMLPTTAEQDQGVVSIGAGYQGEVHQVDVTYSLGLFSGRDIDDSANPAFNGTYDFEAHLLSVAYGRNF